MIIIGIIITVIAIVFIVISIDTVSELLAYVSTVVLGIGLMLIVLGHEETPKAIDVYRGNTTLKITYRDGVPVDSVVILKK